VADDVTAERVALLFNATVDEELSDEVTLAILADATPKEREAVAALHGRLADLSLLRAAGLFRAMQTLAPFWYDQRRSMGAILKVCPPDVADRVVEVLYETGWSERDGLPPRPEEQGHL